MEGLLRQSMFRWNSSPRAPRPGCRNLDTAILGGGYWSSLLDRKGPVGMQQGACLSLFQNLLSLHACHWRHLETLSETHAVRLARVKVSSVRTNGRAEPWSTQVGAEELSPDNTGEVCGLNEAQGYRSQRRRL
jgi:hypothetical protein